MIGRPKFVLASGSPRRLALINQAGIEPDALRPADIDEMPQRGEMPRAYANRLARSQGAGRARERSSSTTNCAAPTSSPPTPWWRSAAASCPRPSCSTRRRSACGCCRAAITASTPAICLVTPKEAFRQRLVETRVRFKRLSERGHRGLSRLRRMARQGRRLRRAGHRRQLHRQDRRLLHQRGRPAAVRDHEPARRRGLPDPLRLAQRGVVRHPVAGRARP